MMSNKAGEVDTIVLKEENKERVEHGHFKWKCPNKEKDSNVVDEYSRKTWAYCLFEKS